VRNADDVSHSSLLTDEQSVSVASITANSAGDNSDCEIARTKPNTCLPTQLNSTG
jgi:hypothetical protein